MSISIEVKDDSATAFGPFPFSFVRILAALSGKKIWNGSASVKFEATPGNVRVLKTTDFEIEWIDKTGDLARQEELEALKTQHDSIERPPLSVDYNPAIPLFEHQNECLNLSWERKFYALLLEMGLGKTAILIANAGRLASIEKVTGVLVYAPKGVHDQWIEEEIPKHIDPRMSVHSLLWEGKRLETHHMKTRKDISFLSMNIDSVRTTDGFDTAKKFLNFHSGRSALYIDESNAIANDSGRTRRAMQLGALATYKRIATGTPIGKNIEDAFYQFGFLNPAILGQKYITAFRARYCVTALHDKHKIVGQKNTEEFYRLIAPHSYRKTKDECLNLPPKIMIEREYEMSEETLRYYRSMKETFLAQFDDGSIVDAKGAAVAMLRLHQIACGHLPTEEGMKLFGGERIETLIDIVTQSLGPIVIWSRFIEDRAAIARALDGIGEGFIIYRGGKQARGEAKRAFLAGEKRIFIAHPKSGGTGLNLQGDCRTVIYFSNSFNALDRWQSEDRTHRNGTKGTVTYYDIIARRSVDRAILRNLKAKKDLATLTFDDIRLAISGMA